MAEGFLQSILGGMMGGGESSASARAGSAGEGSDFTKNLRDRGNPNHPRRLEIKKELDELLKAFNRGEISQEAYEKAVEVLIEEYENV